MESEHKKRKLDLQTDAPENMEADSTISRNSGGGSHSMGGENTKEMFQGKVQKGNIIELHFTKQYRFNMQSTLPSVTFPTLNASHINLKPGSMFLVPVDYLFSYLSPNEYSMLVRSMTQSKFKHVSCEIHSFGIRLPFTTNETSSVTANASSQYPICEWKGLDDDWPVLHNPVTLADTRNKMIGGNFADWSEGSAFPNLSARQTSREFENEAIIQIPRPFHYQPPATVPVPDYGKLGGDIPLHQYVHAINGTMNLGKVFHYEYSPHFGQFQCQSTHYDRTATTNTGIPQTNAMKNDADNGLNLQMGNQPSFGFVNGLGTTTDNMYCANDPPINNAMMVPAEPLRYETAKVENQVQFDFRNRNEPRRQKHFIIGMQFLRNNDDTLLVANWEVMMTFNCKIECRMGTSGLYGLYNDIPISQWLYPTVQMGNYGDAGSTLTATNVGNISRDRVGTNTVQRRGIYNKDTLTYHGRTAEDKFAFDPNQFPPTNFTSSRRSLRLENLRNAKKQLVERNFQKEKTPNLEDMMLDSPDENINIRRRKK